MEKRKLSDESLKKARREGNHCIALGVGVGGLGTAAALTLGATCPLCFIAAPPLIGMGVYSRLTSKGPSQHQDLPTKKVPSTKIEQPDR